MNLDWYYTFIVVAKHLNYRKASEDLFISQTAVFNQIKNLEKELEMNLFENHKNNISLTKAGCEFLLIAQEIIELNEKKIIKLKEVQNAPKMMVNLLVSSYIAIYIIPKFLLEAFEHFPNIDINVKVLKDNQEISSKSTDLLILRDNIPEFSNNFEKICEGKIKLFVPDTEENKSQLDEKYYLEKYRVIIGEKQPYWKNLKKDLKKVYPQTQYTEIDNYVATENLIRMGGGFHIYQLIYYMTPKKMELS